MEESKGTQISRRHVRKYGGCKGGSDGHGELREGLGEA